MKHFRSPSEKLKRIFIAPICWTFLRTFLMFNVKVEAKCVEYNTSLLWWLYTILSSQHFQIRNTQQRTRYFLTSIHFFVFIEFSSCDSFSIVLWYCLQSCPSWIAFCNLHVVGHEKWKEQKIRMLVKYQLQKKFGSTLSKYFCNV